MIDPQKYLAACARPFDPAADNCVTAMCEAAGTRLDRVAQWWLGLDADQRASVHLADHAAWVTFAELSGAPRVPLCDADVCLGVHPRSGRFFAVRLGREWFTRTRGGVVRVRGASMLIASWRLTDG